MFQDPLVAVMTMLFFCFTGILVIFLFFVRSFSSHTEEIREVLRKQQLSLADIERQLMDMSFVLRKTPVGDMAPTSPNAASRLSERAEAFRNSGDSLASMRQEDLMSLLEGAGQQKKSAPLRFDDQLLPLSAGSRIVAEEYDPVKDPHVFENSLLPDPSDVFYQSRTDRYKTGSSNKQGAPLSLKLDE
ncbi:MAG: hypothetical protein LBD42_06765 [Desulfovibrio sp.]|jgi:hypothetical protein|nr:hypothetical protein [Desulfovibrio sp.]